MDVAVADISLVDVHVEVAMDIALVAGPVETSWTTLGSILFVGPIKSCKTAMDTLKHPLVTVVSSELSWTTQSLW